MLVLKALVHCACYVLKLPIGCVIGQNFFLPKILCSTAANGWHRVWGPKRNVLQFLPQSYRNFLQFSAILPQFFQAWGTATPPPPQHQSGNIRWPPCLLPSQNLSLCCH